MVFSSVIFLFFFLPVTLAGYYIAPNIKIKNIWLLFASLFFYFWGGVSFFPIIIYSIVVNYVSGILIDRSRGSRRKAVLIISIILNLSNLAYWKYAMFLMEIVRGITHTHFDIPTILLPIGISFFTFQGMSYVIDVYRGDVDVQKSIFKLGLYISMFPQLIAGPIVRYNDVEVMLADRNHTLDGFVSGCRRFIIGLAKKAILANSLAAVCDPIFDATGISHTIPVAWTGAVFYTLQLYFDFSGYSDMSVGLGKMFGFDFPENFNYPYISLSPSDFWRRWHMSLSRWFRDYVYIPLGGNRKGNVYLNLFIVFVLTGIWHGASYNMLIWGIYWGILVVGHRFIRQHIKSLSGDDKNVQWYLKRAGSWIMMAAVVIMGWVIFRAPGISEALGYLAAMFGGGKSGPVQFGLSHYVHFYECFILAVSLFAMLPAGKALSGRIKERMTPVSYQVLACISSAVLFMISILYVVTETYNPFIYFQF